MNISLKIKKFYLPFKIFVSFSYLFIAIFSYMKNKTNPIYFYLIFTALIFSFIADILLALTHSSKPKTQLNKLLLAGIICFCMTHIIYSASFIYLGSFNILVVMSTILISLAFIIFFKSFKSLNFNTMSTPAFIYIIAICFMVCNAVSLSNCNINDIATKLIITGALLFMISDFIIYFILFTDNPPKFLGVFNLIFYYASQILIALSILHV